MGCGRAVLSDEKQLVVLSELFTHFSFFPGVSGYWQPVESWPEGRLPWKMFMFRDEHDSTTRHSSSQITLPSQFHRGRVISVMGHWFFHIYFIHSVGPCKEFLSAEQGSKCTPSLWPNSPDRTLTIQVRVRFPLVYFNCQCSDCKFSELCRKFLIKMKAFGKCLRKQTADQDSLPQRMY